MLTEEQLSERRKGITATDVAKIVGQSPYGCALDVQMDKAGKGRPFVEHDRVRWGNILENPIRQDYARRHGMIVLEGDTIRHPTEPWALATPDSTVHVAPSLPPLWGHEIKTHTGWLSHLYGEPGTDQVPAWELLQCAWNTWVASAYFGVQIERWDLTVFLDGLPTDYTIQRDPDLESTLVEVCRDFWERHIAEGEPISPDGSEHYSEILKDRWPTHKEGQFVEATAEHVELVRQLRALRAASKDHEEAIEQVTQQLQLAIGDGEALIWGEEIDGKEVKRKISWKRSKDGTKTDWKGLASTYRGRLDADSMKLPDDEQEATQLMLDADAAPFTIIKPGSRRFTVPRAWGKK